MGSLRDIRRRIASVKNTRQITRAMKLVAGARLRRATEAATRARPYQASLSRVLARVARAAGEVEHDLLRVPANDTDIVVVVLSSDRGLCGSFNSNIVRATQERVDRLQADGKKVRIHAYGRKAVQHFRKRGYDVVAGHEGLEPSDYAGATDELAALLVRELGEDAFEKAYLAYNEFRSVMSQKPVFRQLLPMVIGEGEEDAEEAEASEYLFEPEAAGLLGTLLPMALRTEIHQAFLETQAGEQAARMTAMDSATRNASELIDVLTLEYNRARQAAITTELIEIVSGAEAL